MRWLIRISVFVLVLGGLYRLCACCVGLGLGLGSTEMRCEEHKFRRFITCATSHWRLTLCKTYFRMFTVRMAAETIMTIRSRITTVVTTALIELSFVDPVLVVVVTHRGFLLLLSFASGGSLLHFPSDHSSNVFASNFLLLQLTQNARQSSESLPRCKRTRRWI